MAPQITRRGLLKTVALGSAAAAAPGLFAKAAPGAQSDEWIGYTICDSCNHVPQCGIRFYAKGNTVTRIENWTENPRNILCSKGLSTLQRLYNPASSIR